MTTRARDNLTAYTFLAPFLIIFAVFLVYPVLYSVFLAVHEPPADSFDVFSNLRFVGLANFVKLFHDTRFWWSVLMTLYYAALIVPSGIAASLALALLLNNRLKGVKVYRSAFFMPYVLDMLVVGIVWTLIYSPHVGIVVRLLEAVGITAFSERGFLGTAGHRDARGRVHERPQGGRLRHDPLPVGDPEHPGVALRGGRDRRGDRVAAVQAHHAAAPQADHALHGRRRHHLGAERVRGRVRDDERRAERGRRREGARA